MEIVKTADVLIVEDSEDVLWILGNVLENAGFTIDAATTGEEAIERMRECPEIKLIILDYLLPDMNGLTVLKRLRENGSQVKVIVTSTLKIIRESLLEAGVFAFLGKPFDLKEFIGLCKQALNRENAEPGIASES